MKIKLSKSQWEKMGKKAGWMKKAQFENETYYEIRVGMGLLSRHYNIEEANKRFDFIINDNIESDDSYYLIEVTKNVLREERAKKSKI